MKSKKQQFPKELTLENGKLNSRKFEKQETKTVGKVPATNDVSSEAMPAVSDAKKVLFPKPSNVKRNLKRKSEIETSRMTRSKKQKLAYVRSNSCDIW